MPEQKNREGVVRRSRRPRDMTDEELRAEGEALREERRKADREDGFLFAVMLTNEENGREIE